MKPPNQNIPIPGFSYATLPSRRFISVLFFEEKLSLPKHYAEIGDVLPNFTKKGQRGKLSATLMTHKNSNKECALAALPLETVNLSLQSLKYPPRANIRKG